MKHILLFLSLMACISCSKENDRLQWALNQSGKNRKELEKVLTYYKANPTDSLKYKAAAFLIENMVFYYYYEGEQLNNYQTLFETIAKDKHQDISGIMNEYAGKYGHFSLNNLDIKYDIQEISAGYLIHNIEQAFKVWKEQPWGENISFENFCEFILPYRLGNEQLVSWRDSLYNIYNPLLDDFRNDANADDPLYAAMALMDTLTKRERVYTTAYPFLLPHVGPFACQWMVGSCREFADFPMYVCRALGIPCGEDLMSLRGDDNAGHSWNFYLDKYGNNYMQEFPRPIFPAKNSYRIVYANPLKVYRKTFSVNEMFKKDFEVSGSSPHPLFRIPLFVDVTDKYLEKTYCVKIDKANLYTDVKYDNLLYLCMATYKEWRPVAWGTCEDHSTSFNNLGIGSVYRIATYKDKQLQFVSEPFSIEKNGKPFFYATNGEKQNLVIYSKFNLKFEDELFQKTVNGVFEGSNEPDFSECDTLFVIRESPERLLSFAHTNSSNTYKYARYRGADNSHCHIAEIAFYENDIDSIPLKGEIIGTSGSRSPNGKHEYTNALDGNLSTSFEYKQPCGGWVGLAFEQPRGIAKIRYTPPNRENFIRPYNTYELFYFDKEWVYVDRKETSADSVVFPRVPANALFYLDCFADGIQRRVFRYKDGKQIYL